MQTKWSAVCRMYLWFVQCCICDWYRVHALHILECVYCAIFDLEAAS